MRIVFFGSPDFALPSLEALVAAGHDVVLAVSQPAKPVGRSAEVADPPVARRARELAIPVFQPPTLKDEEAVARLAEANADLFVVVAYGKILAQRVLDLPRLGCVNVHGSVLPRWRGASPVQAALLAGDAETGVSIMRMEAGMDTGPVYAVSRTPIGADEDAGTLSARLARDGAALLVDDASADRRGRGRGGPPGRRARDRSARRSAARTAGPTSPDPPSSSSAGSAPSPRGPASSRSAADGGSSSWRPARWKAGRGSRRARSWRPETRSSSRAAKGRSR